MKRIACSGAGQQGIVSLMVTLMLMIVITLVVLGFAEVSRRDTQQSLDQQLSSQAFYAAESAVNDARHILLQELVAYYSASHTPLQDKKDCKRAAVVGPSSDYAGLDGTVATTQNNVSYTCLTVNTQVDNVQENLSPNDEHSTVIPIHANAPVSAFQFTWGSADPNNPLLTQCPSKGPNTNYAKEDTTKCSFGLLRLDLVSLGTLTRDSMMNNTITQFLYPSASGTVSTLASPISASGATNVKCSGQTCTAIVQPTQQNLTEYGIRVNAMYNSIPLVVTALDSSGNAISVTGSQAQIDATGKAQDVLRRISVRMPLSPPPDQSLYADAPLITDFSICKRFTIAPITNGYNKDVSADCN